MATVERLAERGNRRADQALGTLGQEFRDKRVAVGLSQQRVAEAAGIARSTLTRIEAGNLPGLSISMASRIAAVLGLDLSVRVYPGANPLRDAAHGQRLGKVLSHVSAPLTWGTEVTLPGSPERPFEQRAWDACLVGAGRRRSAWRWRCGSAMARNSSVGLR